MLTLPPLYRKPNQIQLNPLASSHFLLLDRGFCRAGLAVICSLRSSMTRPLANCSVAASDLKHIT
jgi:hypothetical protein